MKFLFDFFPILLFFIAYKLYGIYVATAVAIAASFLQVSLYWLKHRRFEKMHVVTLVLIAILGGATLLLQDKAFFMWKPTAVNWAFALGFFLSQLIGGKNDEPCDRGTTTSLVPPEPQLDRFFYPDGLCQFVCCQFLFPGRGRLV